MGNNLKAIREKRGYSLHGLESITGLYYLTLHYIESGKTDISKIQYGSMVKLCNALKCTPYELTNDESVLEFSKKKYRKNNLHSK